MYKRLTLILITVCLALVACSSPTKVVFTEGLMDQETNMSVYTISIQNPPKGTDWRLWFCMNKTAIELKEGSQGRLEHLGGTLYLLNPEVDTKGTALSVMYECKPLDKYCRAPEAFCLEMKDGNRIPIEVEYSFQPSEEVEKFHYSAVPTTPYDMIPSLKVVQFVEGTTDIQNAAFSEIEIIEGQKPGWYRIMISDPVRISASDEEGAYYASVTLDNIKRNAGGEPVENAIVEDWPDLQYRGLMLDVSRNFTKKDDILKILDVMAHYKANYFHLHFGDDEGWRVEIEDLPELTSFGAFREIPELGHDGELIEKNGLIPAYSATQGVDDLDAAGNGYYSKSDFIEILKYAGERHIKVIPEFDTPGHSRASIRAMKVRAERTGDKRFLLSEHSDTSKYDSVQHYNDNVINVALPSAYSFIEKIFDGIIEMYNEAGVPQEAIHIGGDEVPEGSWTGSPACHDLLEKAGMTDTFWMKDYFTNRMLDIAEERGIKLAGWQELAQNLESRTLERLMENLAFVDMWAVSRGRDELTYKYANNGIDVVAANAPNCYFDMAYYKDRGERGASWSGFVDERRSFSLLPFDIYRSVRWDDNGVPNDLIKAAEGKTELTAEGRSHIIGVQGQLWAETIRTFEQVTYYYFPKSLGLFERGWNASPSWEGTTDVENSEFYTDFNRFFSTLVTNEYPYYDSIGLTYHRHQK